ncbi:MAG: SCO family protein [Nitrospinae bacterium]|nr:SCO family protein [Nitrospinota bacterium]
MYTFGKHRAVVMAAALILFFAAQGSAQGFRPPESELDPATLLVDEINVLGTKLDGGLTFVGSDGKEFSMKDLRGRPVIMVLSYYSCDGFCPAFNGDLKKVLDKAQALKNVKIGKDFSVLTLSFDKNDNASSAEIFSKSLGIPSDMKGSWYVATFKDHEDIKKLTSNVGFKFFWSPADRMFFHSSAYYFISPEGRVLRILQSQVSDARDMELAILESKFEQLKPADAGNIAMSMCYSYNFKDGKYRLNYPLFVSFGSLLTGVAAFLFAANIQRKKVKRGKETKI